MKSLLRLLAYILLLIGIGYIAASVYSPPMPVQLPPPRP